MNQGEILLVDLTTGKPAGQAGTCFRCFSHQNDPRGGLVQTMYRMGLMPAILDQPLRGWLAGPASWVDHPPGLNTTRASGSSARMRESLSW